jgi:hypothetical protein
MAATPRATTRKLDAAPAVSPAAASARQRRMAEAKALRAGAALHSDAAVAKRTARAAALKALRGGGAAN